MNNLPDLRVRHDNVGSKARFDLRRFLYIRPYASNGKALDPRWFFRRIEQSGSHPEKLHRLALVLEIKEFFEMRLVSGWSLATVEGDLAGLQLFFDFCDHNGCDVTLDNLVEAYLEYCEYLFLRCNATPPELKKTTAFKYSSTLSTIFGEILGIPASIALVKRTRLVCPPSSKKAVGRVADKQNLEDTCNMGRFLIALAKGISVNSVLGPLPLRIPFQNPLGEYIEVVINLNKTRVVHDAALYDPRENLTASQRRSVEQIKKSRAPVEHISGTKRSYLVTLRVTAEFLIFIAQTGMNVTTAQALTRSEFRYKPAGDQWQVRAFKRRRGGEVMFSIYKSYKPHLQEYLRFIDHFFPSSDLLFPSCDRGGNPSSDSRVLYLSLRKLLLKNGIPWIPPIMLRHTRANWFLRRSGGDLTLTAEMLQHVRETLRDKYELPSQQRATAEITRFWHRHDQIDTGFLKNSLIAGHCSGEPTLIENRPGGVVAPNCINQSGCLWCKSLRDIDSFDYIWSLASFRHLKTLEAAGVIRNETFPADKVIDRLNAKIAWFEQESEERAQWVNEAQIRVAEGYYHPDWASVLDFLES